MSGHSKWSSIKHKKGAADAKRGKIFTKLVKEIIVAAKEGGGDQEMNPRLRLAVSTAKGANMPNSNIERAIKRGTGELEGVNYEHLIYEGYGQNGVAIIVETLTDNKQRTVADVRHIFSKYGGNLAENGSVSYMFEKKGMIVIPEDDLDEDEVMMASLDAGAEDFIVEEGDYIIYTAYADLHSVLKKMEEANYNIEKAEITRIPQNTINADEVAEKLLKLIDHLEDCDDVQKVYANFKISDIVFERLSED